MYFCRYNFNYSIALTRKKINKGLIVLTKGERISVISMLAVIIILLGFSVFRPMIDLPKRNKMAFHKLDSLLAIQEATRKAPPENKLYNEETPKKANVRKPVQSSSKKSTSEKEVEAKKEDATKPFVTPKQTKTMTPIDINLADSTELIALPQIGEVMASRIHRYRNRLGGFINMEQLFEIKGMDQERYETIKPYIILKDKTLTKINVNQDEFKALLRHPYLEYEQVKAIVNHRERKGLIGNWEQLKEITGEVNPLLEHYVTY